MWNKCLSFFCIWLKQNFSLLHILPGQPSLCLPKLDAWIVFCAFQAVLQGQQFFSNNLMSLRCLLLTGCYFLFTILTHFCRPEKTYVKLSLYKGLCSSHYYLQQLSLYLTISVQLSLLSSETQKVPNNIFLHLYPEAVKIGLSSILFLTYTPSYK